MKRFAFAAVLAACTLTPCVSAQTNAGTTVGQFLLIEPSARLAAMGNAGVTSADEVLAAYYNPGALGALDASDAQFTHAPWFAGITYDHAAVALRVPRVGNLMLSATLLNSGDIAVRTVDQPLGTGEQYQVQNLAFGVGYGRRITDRFAAGAQVTFLRETIWRSSLSAVGFNVGVRYQLVEGGPVLGASLVNFGTRGRYDGLDLSVRFNPDPGATGNNSALPAEAATDRYSLPVLFRVGVGWPVRLGGANRVLFAVDAAQPSDNTESLSLGAEWTYGDLLALRAGYQNLFQQDAEGGLTLGGGLRYALPSATALRFDYAWNSFGRIGNAQRFTVGFSF